MGMEPEKFLTPAEFKARSVRLAEAPSFGKPICLYDPTSAGAIAYKELAEEVLNVS
jgi:cellulose biosynthesis protein BcsQ